MDTKPSLGGTFFAVSFLVVLFVLGYFVGSSKAQNAYIQGYRDGAARAYVEVQP